MVVAEGVNLHPELRVHSDTLRTILSPMPAYDVHPSVRLMEYWIDSLKGKTGRSLAGWVAFIKKEGPKDEKAARDWLTTKHALGTNTAWWLAERAFAAPGSRRDDTPAYYLDLAPGYVEAQYAGKKGALRPIFERLVTLARKLGKDAKVCPCETIVPLYREHVFAQIKPTTNTRVDLGLCLTPMLKLGKKPPARLIDTGGFAKKDRITHRIPLESVGDIDAFVGEWLAKAYEMDRPRDEPPARTTKRRGTITPKRPARAASKKAPARR